MTVGAAPAGQAKRLAELAANWRGIPLRPRERSLILPVGPPRALSNAFGLVDAHTPARSLLVACARGFSKTGMMPLIPVRRKPANEVGHRLQQLLPKVAGSLHQEPAVMAVAIRDGRIDVLLMDPAGVPVAFLKLATGANAEGRMTSEARVLEGIRTPAKARAHIPRILARGEVDGRSFHVYEPLPDGPHGRPAPDPELIAAVAHDVRDRLADLPRRGDVPIHFVPGHGDFTHRNLRAAGDGSLWLLDWEYARWMPPLADELRYWTAHHAYSLRLNPRRAAGHIVNVLRTRGSDDDIREAVAFPVFNRPREQAIRSAVGELLASTAVA
jgi:hypothetical protein